MSAYVAGKYLSATVKKLMWRRQTYQYVWRIVARLVLMGIMVIATLLRGS